MRTRWVSAAGGIIVLLVAGQTQLKSAAPPRSQIERGRYITHDVAMCVQCHTPRDADGNLIENQLFHGAPLLVKSPFPNWDWAVRAPHVAGLPGLTDEQVIRLLRTGRAPDRDPPRPPMPSFRMTQEDAAAVVSYLRSL